MTSAELANLEALRLVGFDGAAGAVECIMKTPEAVSLLGTLRADALQFFDEGFHPRDASREKFRRLRHHIPSIPT